MNIHSIETGFFSTDGGAMFGILSRKVWSGKYPVDSENRCPLAMRILFAEIGDHKVLFDTGVGSTHVKGGAYYRFHDLKDPIKQLEKLGYSKDDITDVVLSHLHFDHCGGSVCVQGDGTLLPAFPNATYWASEKQCAMSKKPPLWEADSFAPEVIQILMNAGQLSLIDSDRELFPGLRVKLVSGHTDDQILSYISTSLGVVVYCGDIIPMAPHILPLCIAAVDNSAVISVEEKSIILKEAVEDNQILFFFHDAVTKAARIKNTNGRYSIKELITL